MSTELDELFGDVDNSSSSSTIPTAKPKGEKFSIWDDTPVPREFDLTSLERGDKSYIVASHGKVPYELLEKSEALFKHLNDKGYVLHSSGDIRDKLCNVAAENCTTKYYLPFAKFNSSVKAEVPYPFRDAYDLSSNYAYKYENLSNPVKGFIAKNIHVLTGALCNKPVKFILIYTECGKDTNFKIDYKSTGNDISNYLKFSEVLNIPVFNLKNPDALEKFKKFLGEQDG